MCLIDGFGVSEKQTRWAAEQAGVSIGCGSGELAVATKFAPVPWRSDADSVVEACRQSAERLGVSQIPLYQIHFPDIIQPLKAFGVERRKDELYWEGLARCYEQGLVANVGVCVRILALLLDAPSPHAPLCLILMLHRTMDQQ